MDFSKKHPLRSRWTLWYYEDDSSNTWALNLKEVSSFDTVEDFWSLYNHVKLASELQNGCDYSLFKAGIKPMWEDVANEKGGRWLIRLDRNQRYINLDRCWMDILLLLIGEAFENSNEVCGAVLNIRPTDDKISIWTSNAAHQEAVMKIRRILSEWLVIKPNTIVYQIHAEAMIKASCKKDK